MGIQRRTKTRPGIVITAKKLEMLITGFLTEHEPDMVADYRPTDEQWRKLLAEAMAAYVVTHL